MREGGAPNFKWPQGWKRDQMTDFNLISEILINYFFQPWLSRDENSSRIINFLLLI